MANIAIVMLDAENFDDDQDRDFATWAEKICDLGQRLDLEVTFDHPTVTNHSIRVKSKLVECSIQERLVIDFVLWLVRIELLLLPKIGVY